MFNFPKYLFSICIWIFSFNLLFLLFILTNVDILKEGSDRKDEIQKDGFEDTRARREKRLLLPHKYSLN